MIYLTFALCYCASLAACAYMVIHGHPWFGAATLLCN